MVTSNKATTSILLYNFCLIWSTHCMCKWIWLNFCSVPDPKNIPKEKGFTLCQMSVGFILLDILALCLGLPKFKFVCNLTLIFAYSRYASTIARFDQSAKKWSKLGFLVTARYGAGVVYDGQSFLAVGGIGEKSTEECKMEDMSMTCTSRSPKLNQFYRWPTFVPFYDDSDQ